MWPGHRFVPGYNNDRQENRFPRLKLEIEIVAVAITVSIPASGVDEKPLASKNRGVIAKGYLSRLETGGASPAAVQLHRPCVAA